MMFDDDDACDDVNGGSDLRWLATIEDGRNGRRDDSRLETSLATEAIA